MGRPVCVRLDTATLRLVDQASELAGFDTRSDWLAHLIDRGLAGAGLLDVDEIAARREARDAREHRGPRAEHAGATAEADARAMVAEQAARLERFGTP